MPGALAPAASRGKNKNHTSVVTTGPPGSPGIPARNGFNGFLLALPGDRAFLSPSPALLLADLTPASRRQDHTTSPSAPAPFVKSALASIASRPASVTIAKRPFEEQNARTVKVICPTPEAKYFLRRDWTGSISLSWFNKFAVTRKVLSPRTCARQPTAQRNWASQM